MKHNKSATYYLISTTNSQVEGWTIYASGTKEYCKKEADTNPHLTGDKTQLHRDIYAQVLEGNKKIVSKTEAIKKYGLKHQILNTF